MRNEGNVEVKYIESSFSKPIIQGLMMKRWVVYVGDNVQCR